jgi:hypothetical protein
LLSFLYLLDLDEKEKRRSDLLGGCCGQMPHQHSTGNKKGLSVSEKAFKFMELAMGLEPATG